MPSDPPALRPPLSFYAPLKSPDDPVPSGDRTVARLLLAALERAGLAPKLASRFRSFSGDGTAQNALLAAGADEAERVYGALEPLPEARRPRLWLTYHSYYKAPDLIGPVVSRRLAIPYVLVEASHADKRAGGPFDLFHRRAADAVRAADLHLVLNRRDEEGLRRLRGGGNGIVRLAPFVGETGPSDPAPLSENGPLRLVTVAMMRPGDKFSSYRILADALGRAPCDWVLDVAGDGAARGEVEAAFAPLAERVRFHGLVTEPDRLAALVREADLLAWPGVNEAFGMTYLEAARYGRPALAMRYGGVPEVVEDGVSGLLVDAGDADAYALALEHLALDRARLRRLGAGARERSESVHGFDAAARRLSQTLAPLLSRSPVCAS
ncbi:glycosyltransferase family 4 protein [Aureimonas jatrophae]|uniref:Glycosyltransferase involved in cell wall bisynthesis n=1 Tax=Aureimonas jatrophae TaxID=1166073 RepID=A0A1H0EVR7_9HYPH|nr:glycosyltransferase family 4 protein [Aureimonas jatrophae]MBB3950293.1 glycosyltransferase involved in cell wall biosynthesis [Aureimonas jatrophae]SDN86433.1 Glycosyltransferase involved in cell wall bisynthesis [Aureimonas jatrophae]